jgi:hypothetical protein
MYYKLVLMYTIVTSTVLLLKNAKQLAKRIAETNPQITSSAPWVRHQPYLKLKKELPPRDKLHVWHDFMIGLVHDGPSSILLTYSAHPFGTRV